MDIYVPLWILLAPLWWLIVGTVLFPVLSVMGSYAYPDPRHRGWRRLVWETRERTARAFLAALVIWPSLLWELSRALLATTLGFFVEWRWAGETDGNRCTDFQVREIRGWRWLCLGYWAASFRSTGARWVRVGPLMVGLQRESWAFVPVLR